MTTKEHKDAVKLIDKAFCRLNRVCDNLREWSKYVALINEEEKGHRRVCFDGIEHGLTRAQSVRLFAVTTLFQRFVVTETETVFTPEAKDFFTIRHSVFGACAIAELNHVEIRNEFPEQEMIDFLKAIDYAELNKDPKELAA